MKDRSHPSSFLPHPSSPISIGIAVVEHEGRYLVGMRGPDSPLPGLSEFPGGKCRPGESPQDCAARECQEETGLAVSPVSLLINCRHDYGHGRVDLHFWLCRPAAEGLVEADHRGYRWIPAAGLKSLDFPAANAPLLDLLTS
jgi:8-oxo-dGTP diphosphatase